ncbi:MAG TPA: hypothetical protein VNF29_12155, partial [Candidatus Binataceae bacterium]|nr:hypothetical protein [Candidatus Binataceae bacterium]
INIGIYYIILKAPLGHLLPSHGHLHPPEKMTNSREKMTKGAPSQTPSLPMVWFEGDQDDHRYQGFGQFRHFCEARKP